MYSCQVKNSTGVRLPKKIHSLHRVRHLIGMTQKDFAFQIGISSRMLQSIELGERRLSEDVVDAVYLLTGVTPESLKKGIPQSSLGGTFDFKKYQYWRMVCQNENEEGPKRVMKERENLSTQPIRSNKATPNLIAPIESEPELPDNDRPDLQQPASLQDAIKHLQSKSIEDEEIDEENASFYSKYCKPKYMAYVGIFFAFYLSGYYLFFAPAYSLPENKEVIHGKVMLDNKPLVSGAVIAVVNDKEVSGPIGPTGTYRIQNPPKGDLNFKVVSFITLTKGLPKPKNISVVPPVYNKLNKELALNYKGGIKVFDINLKMPVPPPNK